MLKQRVVTAIFLLLGFGSVLFLAGPLGFAVAMAIVVLVGAWEWSNLSGLETIYARLGYVCAMACALLLSHSWLAAGGVDALRSVLMAACLWWTVALLWVQGYPSSGIFLGAPAVRLFIGFFVLVPAWHSLVYLHALEAGQWLVLGLIILVAAADTGAYFTGKAIGKRKLAPKVSPGKTWEGALGGALLALCLTGCALAFTTSAPLYLAAVIALPAAFVSVLGDLFESMLKRHRGVKDSSTLLPGHGGVLDRLDGLVAAAPVYVLTLLVIPWPN